MTFFDHKDLGNHLLQLCPKVVKHPVYIYIYIIGVGTGNADRGSVCVCVRQRERERANSAIWTNNTELFEEWIRGGRGRRGGKGEEEKE